MTEAKTPDSRNWLAERLCKPLDRLWLAGVLAVNALVWAAFDAKYIGLALIAYCVVFILALRRRINVAYPAEADKEYRIGYIYKWPRLSPVKSEKVFLHALWVFPLYCVTATVLSVLFGSVSALSKGLVLFVCNGVLLCQYQSLFAICCGGGRLAKGHNDSLSSLRLTITTIVFVLIWCCVLVAYITGQMGGVHFFGIAEYGADRLYAATLSLALPAILHIVLFETSISTLRGLGGKL